MESLKALLWWNPFAWIAARRLIETEEFEADSDVLEGGYDRELYMNAIFRQLFGYSPEIANGLRDSLTKKTIQDDDFAETGQVRPAPPRGSTPRDRRPPLRLLVHLPCRTDTHRHPLHRPRRLPDQRHGDHDRGGETLREADRDSVREGGRHTVSDRRAHAAVPGRRPDQIPGVDPNPAPLSRRGPQTGHPGEGRADVRRRTGRIGHEDLGAPVPAPAAHDGGAPHREVEQRTLVAR